MDSCYGCVMQWTCLWLSSGLILIQSQAKNQTTKNIEVCFTKIRFSALWGIMIFLFEELTISDYSTKRGWWRNFSFTCKKLWVTTEFHDLDFREQNFEIFFLFWRSFECGRFIFLIVWRLKFTVYANQLLKLVIAETVVRTSQLWKWIFQHFNDSLSSIHLISGHWTSTIKTF